MEQDYVKVEIPLLRSTKRLKVESGITVTEMIKTAVLKMKAPVYEDYLPFQVSASSEIPLDPSKLVSSYNFSQEDVFLIRRTPKSLSLKLEEGDQKKKILVDFDTDVGNLLITFQQYFELKKLEDTTLHLESDENPLDKNKSLQEQNVKTGSTCVIRQKKVNVSAIAKNVSEFITKNIQQGAGIIRKVQTEVMATIDQKLEQKKGENRNVDNSKKLFGAPLEEGVKVGENPYEIPLMIEKALQFIEAEHMKTEGIFRLSGAATVVNSLRDRFEKGEDVNMSEITDPHAVAALVKMYLRELPEPILTFNYFPVFCSIVVGPPNGQDLRGRYLRAVIKALPRTHYLVLKRLFGFVVELVKYAEFTKMHARNLATVFGPNLLHQQNESAMQTVENTMTVTSVADEIIRHYSEIFDPIQNEPKFVYFARALYNYDANTESELSITEGRIVFVTNAQSTDGWWEAELAGKFGLCPANYLEILTDLTTIELNDEVARASQKLKEEVQALQKIVKREQNKRKELEDSIKDLFEKMQTLMKRIELLESKNKELLKKTVSLGYARNSGGEN